MSGPVPLHTSVRGEGAAVVLLHGLYGSGGNLGRLARALATRYRVFTPDLRNHGRSPHHPVIDYPTMAADVEALMQRHGVDRAAVLGHSMGGKVAMTLALQAPQRVAALVAADIAPVAYPPSHHTLIARLQAVAVEGAVDRAEIDAALAQTIPERAVRQFLLTNLRPLEGGGYGWRIPLATLAAALPEIEGFPRSATTYAGPALFVYGARSDYFVPARDAVAVEALFPRARYTAIPDAGHWLHAEQPDDFAEAVSAFLETALAAPRAGVSSSGSR